MRLALLFIVLCLAPTLLAELKYEQSLAMGNYISHEEAKKTVGAFIIAAKGDPNILVKKVEYKQRGKDDCIFYEGIVTCYVSEIDKDLMRITLKASEIREKARLESLSKEIEDHMEE